MKVAPVRDVRDPLEVGRYVYQAADAVRAKDPGALLEAVGVLLQHNNWQHYVDPLDEQSYTWHDFRRFVETKLETTVERLVGALDSPALGARVLELATAPKHRHHSAHDRTNGTISRTRAAAEMRRLLHERPDLASQVEAGKKSVHAASVEAGWRKPTATIPIDSPESAVRALLRRFSRESLIAALDASNTGSERDK